MCHVQESEEGLTEAGGMDPWSGKGDKTAIKPPWVISNEEPLKTLKPRAWLARRRQAGVRRGQGNVGAAVREVRRPGLQS